MSETMPQHGRLIALEGFRNTDLRRGASHLLRSLEIPKFKSGISLWDASGIFFELARGPLHNDPASAKTLMILYATDLAFRLRWEIEPAIGDARTVVAAPYTRTAIAVGQAAGLSAEWLTSLFAFAPVPKLSLLLECKPHGACWTPRAASGFADFGYAALARISPRFVPEELLDKTADCLGRDVAAGLLKLAVVQ